jgi:hypothetical protein
VTLKINTLHTQKNVQLLKTVTPRHSSKGDAGLLQEVSGVGHGLDGVAFEVSVPPVGVGSLRTKHLTLGPAAEREKERESFIRNYP